ncbi:hypothetical protein SPRG_03398 [Saprolegnia parasitica CBS 223.65]|uniref:F-box domain-containing protein n=1 Tax=Saprolegnia parasitica (strain CBS 223.65) TaxID=695850 RepID=A0A067D0C2_SAPPC|nr:hypothetical protein SPRG_03398 [Saprolegnia parasitica CBS 223.65]KDO32181.1 hypothetical protein SPRG_03398 [Saprolegnia parasitica CBS 223.65]|eukprot:XP_012197362.1 hypothetical protein SPRG_03398 [Saprolegnia parasitica CBS 223.65]
MQRVFESNELLHEVLAYLGVRDLGAASQVCLRWHLLGSHDVLWVALASRALHGPETTALHELLGHKAYLRQLARACRQPSHDGAVHFIESAAWPRLCARDKWLARTFIASSLDALTSTAKASEDPAYPPESVLSGLLCAYADLLEENFADLAAAASLLRRAIPFSPDPARLLHNLALLEDKQGNLDAAEAAFREAHAADPRYQRVLCNYAVFLDERRQRFEAARAMYEAALANDPTDLDTYAAFADFLTFKQPDLDRAEGLFRNALRHLATLSTPLEDGQDLKIIIQFAEFLAYVQQDMAAATPIYRMLLPRPQREPMHARAHLLLCVGLLSYAIASVFACNDYALGRQLVVEAMTLSVYQSSDDLLLLRYKRTAACVVHHEFSLTTTLDVDALGPLAGLLLYLTGDMARALQLWATCIESLDSVHQREYAFAGYCLGVVFHLRGGPAKRPLATQVLAKALTSDVHGVELRNVCFLLREYVRSRPSTAAAGALAFLDVLTQYELAHQSQTNE